jgi:hypothetical protein
VSGWRGRFAITYTEPMLSAPFAALPLLSNGAGPAATGSGAPFLKSRGSECAAGRMRWLGKHRLSRDCNVDEDAVGRPHGNYILDRVFSGAVLSTSTCVRHHAV